MPKRKRDSSLDKIEKYRKKIERLEKKRRKRQRFTVQSSSESESDHAMELDELDPEMDPGTVPQDPPTDPDATNNVIPNPEVTNNVTPDPDVTNNPTPDVNPEAALPELDAELLLALGDETSNKPKFGDKIHKTLADRWEPLLKKGLEKEVREKLLKEHLVPENCTLLQAPKLNVEVAAAISETARGRDKRKKSDQQQLGHGITAISKAMTILLTSENKIEAIKLLSEGCRILTDLHYQETQARISVINYSLAKPFLNVVQDCERDDTLYGNKLSDKIKASKIIEKQGLQIKKYNKKPTSTDKTTTNSRPQNQQGSSTTNQGNWSGPPRYQQNRGGRRGQRGTSATQNRRPPPPPASTSTSTSANQAKPRAPARS